MNIYFAYQLANALQYFSHLNLIHGDVATRNCLFYSDYTIKLTDCAMAFSQYEHEYWPSPNGQLIPLRWIAPEALTVSSRSTSSMLISSTGHFSFQSTATIYSDIYSFAVSLWEIWSRCSCLPHLALSNEEVYQHLLAQQYPSNSESPHDLSFHVSLPADCPKEIYDLLCECWRPDGDKRPNIADITLYFRRHIDATRVNASS